MNWTTADLSKATDRQKPASGATSPRGRRNGAGEANEARRSEKTEAEREAERAARKDAAQRRQEAELSRLNQQAVVHYQVGTGETTLGTTKVFHLHPEQQRRLHAFLETELGARRL